MKCVSGKDMSQKKAGVDYLNLRESAEFLEELPFSTERKYMVTTQVGMPYSYYDETIAA